MINWAKRLVEELHGVGASPESLSTVVVAILALLFVVLMVVAAVLLLSGA
jgi:hypothetical protein